MQDIFFYIFAALTLLFGFLVVANPFSRNPITSAMFLVLTIISLAGLFILLNAFFLAAVQILVYAGAVIVLFLFVIMLLDLDTPKHRRPGKIRLGLSLLAVGGLAVVFGKALYGAKLSEHLPAPTLQGETAPLGKVLFTQHLLPFEIIGLLLLVAMLGVLLLSKKEVK